MYNVFKKCNNGTQTFFFIVKVSIPIITAFSVNTWDLAQEKQVGGDKKEEILGLS